MSRSGAPHHATTVGALPTAIVGCRRRRRRGCRRCGQGAARRVGRAAWPPRAAAAAVGAAVRIGTAVSRQAGGTFPQTVTAAAAAAAAVAIVACCRCRQRTPGRQRAGGSALLLRPGRRSSHPPCEVVVIPPRLESLTVGIDVARVYPKVRLHFSVLGHAPVRRATCRDSRALAVSPRCNPIRQRPRCGRAAALGVLARGTVRGQTEPPSHAAALAYMLYGRPCQVVAAKRWRWPGRGGPLSPP